jgi:GT2 family glycosyltransferase/peptidoglycan/xylan/chitin deacetylase (PgdA/CDA1 family)
MILMYHKVDMHVKSMWWVSADRFRIQMHALKRFNVVPLADYDPHNGSHVVITFDGVYEDIYKFAFPILKEFGYCFELFVVGNHIGGDNAFDFVEPLARFCTVAQLQAMQNHGARIQWHTANHKKMAGLALDELEAEILVPDHLKAQLSGKDNFKWFAYPHGDHDDAAIALVKRNFEGAISVNDGSPHDRYQYNRATITENVGLLAPRVSVIIANFNYGRFLMEAVQSVLNQSLPADEIVVIDDASTDESSEVLEQVAKFPGVRVVVNEKNLGIVDNFNKAVNLTTGEYVCIVGADNRIRGDYIEKCVDVLNSDPRIGISYTDVMIYGPLGYKLAKFYNAPQFARSVVEGFSFYYWQVSDPTPETLVTLQVSNFIHGSSMYRRASFNAVGGYLKTSRPEDHNLFLRMVQAGWLCKRVPHPVLEYRQHSAAQANTVLGLQNENARLRATVATLQAKVASLESRLSETQVPS